MRIHFEHNGREIARYKTTFELRYGDCIIIKGGKYRIVGWDGVKSIAILEEGWD